MPRKSICLGALAAAALAAGCGGSAERISAEAYWRFKRKSVAPFVEHVDPRRGEIVGTYWLGRSERPSFRVSKEEVEAFAKANPRIVDEAKAHARGVADGYRAGRRMVDPYHPSFATEPLPPYRDARLVEIYKAGWQLGRIYGSGLSPWPHQR